MDHEPGQEDTQIMQLGLPVVFVQRVEQLRFGADAPGDECGAAEQRKIMICVRVAVDVFRVLATGIDQLGQVRISE
ncbi:hypothetical protein [Streptomyces phaeofaciens]|uniref:hypothetical protein n=1 Tax=Streptomyces phaeofaciens TaxID=68254 RepID=UPI00167344DF|nr:hypothetical protein [Streptomyces phaeofaciens]